MLNTGEVRQTHREVLKGTKKRRVMTQELMGKFSSKKDFIKYFEESRK
jgi:ribosomal protein S28E/S33